MSNRSGSPYSTPRDANHVPLLIAASTADGITPVVLEADPVTHQLQVSSSGGGGGSDVQYTDGVATVTHPIGTIPVFNNAGTITAVSVANPLPVSATISTAGLATSANQTTEITNLATIAALSKAEDAPHSSGDTGVPVWAVRNDTGAVFAGSDGDYIPLATDATGALRVDLNGTISTNNSTTSVLAGNATFTGTSEDALNYNEIRISVIASHVSAADGLSIQQSEDNTNWDFTDTYTIPAATGKTYSIPRQARYFRVVYTNGATLQTSFRLQTIMNRLGARVSSQRPNDAYSNETDLEQTQSFLMGYNGTTWDRLRTTGTGVLTTSTVLTAGAAAIGSITNTSFTATQATGTNLHTVIDSGTITTVSAVTAITNALPTGTNSIGKISDITTSVVPGVAATNLGKAEDAPHASGDTGVAAWGVRNDNLATTYGNDQDYGPLATDKNGRVMVAQKAATGTLSNVASSATSTTVLAANSARIGATVTNDSSALLYLKFGATASTTSYTVVLAGAAAAPFSYYEVPAGYTGIIDGIWASATGNARVTEIT